MIGFSPVSATIGGALIGAAVGMLWIVNGRVAGVAGLYGSLVATPRADLLWRVLFLAGLPIGATIGGFAAPHFIDDMARALPRLDTGPFGLAVAGLLVGIGTALARGCTSGHGVFGLASLSPRSIVAVPIFLGSAVATVLVVKLLP